MHDQLTRLRAEVERARSQLIDSEAELADRLAEVNVFEFKYESRVGHLLDTLAALEAEIQRFNERIQRTRSRQIFGQAHVPVEEQVRRTWEKPANSAPVPPQRPLGAGTQAEIKKLYRQLARRFHPDLARDDADRARRTEIMSAVNDAYAARSLVELTALAREPDTGSVIDTGRVERAKSETQRIESLQVELAHSQRRLREIENELRNLPHRASVALGLEVTLARRQGRDLLAEMAADVKHKIARKTVERDMLKAQFDQLGPEEGIIRIDVD